MTRQHDTSDASTIGTSQNCPEVAGVRDPIRDEEERKLFFEKNVKLHVFEAIGLGVDTLVTLGSSVAVDLDGAPVFLSTSAFQLNYDAERNPDITFSDVKDYQKKQG